ncbi:MAG: TetR/AcrR family transcriptional regulator [Coriobacteriaceae bacterium]|jgi:AcrR family transcriptional regulator|nr:TetR/AcrR family transcriptional regulator [Coriobacteriaceae bacterium]
MPVETSEAIKAAFRELLRKTPYDRITIADICQAATIAKRTLYKYFESKADLVNAICYDDFISPLVEVRKILPIDEIRSSQTHLTERDLVTLKDNRDVYGNLLRNFGRMELIDLFITNTAAFNRKVYSAQGFPIENIEFAAYFVAAATTMSKIYWMENGFKESPQQMARLINDFSLAHLLDLRDCAPASGQA